MGAEVAMLDPKAAIARAKREIQEETMSKAVLKLKDKFREQERAKVVLANIERELADLELSIEHGNI